MHALSPQKKCKIDFVLYPGTPPQILEAVLSMSMYHPINGLTMMHKRTRDDRNTGCLETAFKAFGLSCQVYAHDGAVMQKTGVIVPQNRGYHAPKPGLSCPKFFLPLH